MSQFITYLMIVFFACWVVLILIELITKKSLKRFLLEALVICLAISFLKIFTGFPASKTAFGGVSPLLALGIMFICILLGIIAYHFYFVKKTEWRSILKTFIISPLILLPLIENIQGKGDIGTLQLIYFGILSFQNGFFWKSVLR